MNSRSSVNESNLVNFSPDLSTLNALDKEPLLSFPFDHLYACHSESSDCGQSLTLDKNVEISTHCMLQPDQTIQEKDAEILSLRTQNKRLKKLLVYHLDLIQQQNDVITNREKSLSSVQVEFDTLREKIEKQAGKALAPRHLTQSPLFQVPLEPRTISSPRFSPSDPPGPSPESFSNDFNSVLLGTDSTTNSYSKPFGHDPFDMGRPSEALPDLLSSDMAMPTLLDSPLTPLPLHNDYNMIDKLASIKKEINPESSREAKYTVTTNSGSPVIRKIQKNARRKITSLGSLRRIHKTPKQEPSTIYDNEIMTVNSSSKKAKMISTSGNTKLDPLRHPNTGSLSDRLQLIDTTPTGEDPYQIGEAEMREQSPIPRLVLPKNNRVRVHTAAGFELDTSKPMTKTTTNPARRIYDPIDSEPKSKKSKKSSKLKTNRRSTSSHTQFTGVTTPINSTPMKTMKTMKTEPDTTTVKKENDSWERFSKKPRQTSLGDFSYGETSANLATSVGLASSPDNLTVDLSSSKGLLLSADRTSATNLLSSSHRASTVKRLPSTNLVPSTDKEIMSPMDITKMNFTEIFQPESGEDSSYVVQNASMNDIMKPNNFLESTTVTTVTMTVTTSAVTTAMVATLESEIGEPRTKKRETRTVSGTGSSPAAEECMVDARRGSDGVRTECKRGRKRAHSSASSTKRDKPPAKPRSNRGGRGGYRGKRGSWIPVPALTTRTPYHTALGHPDISWYLGHDPDIKKEDVEQLAENTSPNVEVPRWREMVFTSLDSAEGTENTDDEAYRKRHQKLEAEERRQLRWHMRRIREQRHVERLRLRQRDPWVATTQSLPPAYTVWPSPLRDLHTIEITDVIPVLAFGEDIPLLPDVDFRLPWVRVSKAQKRSKRSKTLH